jgi:hypothetical protein
VGSFSPALETFPVVLDILRLSVPAAVVDNIPYMDSNELITNPSFV